MDQPTGVDQLRQALGRYPPQGADSSTAEAQRLAAWNLFGLYLDTLIEKTEGQLARRLAHYSRRPVDGLLEQWRDLGKLLQEIAVAAKQPPPPAPLAPVEEPGAELDGYDLSSPLSLDPGGHA